MNRVNKMKALKKLHRETELHVKIGLPIVIFIILPLAFILLYTVFH